MTRVQDSDRREPCWYCGDRSARVPKRYTGDGAAVACKSPAQCIRRMVETER